MIKNFESGIALGRKHHAKIAAMSDRWKRRNVPSFIRESLFVPYYITESEEFFELYVIQKPIDASEKVHFSQFARSSLNEEECPQIPYSEK
ncbi:hypothetical protein [Dyadobacter sp. CY343]|uniref:hypothetical protein n=1 Tax=Dyadobacter sp. CY343 TaxID=2907299 RepID=UPI001F290DD3|nr:hypothetical protein [Dyadobacter sp. CY343]MCE7061273.1 hypothetical protein [Dyadobacter sp. CY343]